MKQLTFTTEESIEYIRTHLMTPSMRLDVTPSHVSLWEELDTYDKCIMFQLKPFFIYDDDGHITFVTQTFKEKYMNLSNFVAQCEEMKK